MSAPLAPRALAVGALTSTALRARLVGVALVGALAVGADAGHASPTYTAARSNGTTPEADPPSYARRLADTELGRLGLGRQGRLAWLGWLDVGLETRVRLEARESDYTRAGDLDTLPLLQRVRAYLGLREVLDPLRLSLEVMDSRRFHGSGLPEDDREVNALEPVQGFVELYFARTLGEALPLRVRFGRMALELVDRRLVARNNWRNTANTFDGARVTLGTRKGPLEVDVIALAPVERKLYELDRARPGQWLYGAVGTVKLAPALVVQPYFLGLEETPREGSRGRSVQAPALRAHGLAAAVDYDLDVVLQTGTDQGRGHLALGLTAELGVTARVLGTLRASVSYAHATGDRDARGPTNHRFHRMFGFARPFSNNLTFQWENLRAPKLRLALEPRPGLRVDGGYGAYWLDSPTDRWNAPGLRDERGASGTFLGHELDVVTRARLVSRVDVQAGYAFFAPGAFPRALGRSRDGHFAYLELVVRAF